MGAEEYSESLRAMFFSGVFHHCCSVFIFDIVIFSEISNDHLEPKETRKPWAKGFHVYWNKGPYVPISRKEDGGIKESKMIYVYSKRNFNF